MRYIAIFMTLFFAVQSVANEVVLIRPESFVVVDGKEMCKEERCDAKDISYKADLSGIEWLDSLVLEDLLDDEAYNSLSVEDKLEAIRLSVQGFIDDAKAYRDEGEFAHYEIISNISFVSQRHKIATYRYDFYVYSGGAHGSVYQNFRIIDLENAKVITLDDIILPDKSLEFLQALLDVYGYEEGDFFLGQTRGEALGRIIPDAYYADGDGLVLTYNPYHIGPFSDGVIKIRLPSYKLKSLVKSEYLELFGLDNNLDITDEEEE